MPWKVSGTVSERMKLIIRLDQGEQMADLCREFGISRKTGYKFLERYKRYGVPGLYDQKRAPITRPFRTPESVEQKVLELKERYPHWGARKIRERLPSADELGFQIPCTITVHRILRKHGKVPAAKQRKAGNPAFRSEKIRSTSAPNQIWSLDFKGQFQTKDKRLCYPLTLSDHFSRYLLLCESLEGTTSRPAEIALEETFVAHGLPDAILSDNGCPFGSRGIFGLSRISVWLMRLGVEVLRIEPGHPEQNGRHERMHLTLKRATSRPAADNLLQQQEKFDRFMNEYNNERPHEALDMKTPSEVWQKPVRQMPSSPPEPNYKNEDLIRVVTTNGSVNLRTGRGFQLSYAFVDQPIALTEVEEKLWRVKFMNYELGFVDETTEKFKPNEYLNLSPMS
ncbi:MAG: integrase core domain-containing protein [Bdellovibrionales bacterium]